MEVYKNILRLGAPILLLPTLPLIIEIQLDVCIGLSKAESINSQAFNNRYPLTNSTSIVAISYCYKFSKYILARNEFEISGLAPAHIHTKICRYLIIQ